MIYLGLDLKKYKPSKKKVLKKLAFVLGQVLIQEKEIFF